MTTLPAIDFQIWQACECSLIWNPQMDGSDGRLRVVFSFWVVVNSEVVRTLFFCGFLFWISVLLRAMKSCLQNKEMKALYMSWKHRISSWECCKRSAYRVWKMVFAAHVKSTHVNAICSVFDRSDSMWRFTVVDLQRQDAKFSVEEQVG